MVDCLFRVREVHSSVFAYNVTKKQSSTTKRSYYKNNSFDKSGDVMC